MLKTYERELADVTRMNNALVAKAQMGLLTPEEKGEHLIAAVQQARNTLQRAEEVLILEHKLAHLDAETVRSISRRVEIAAEGASILEHSHCSEAFVDSVGSYLFGRLDDHFLRATTGLAGGVGGTHEGMCGGLIGGVLCIGAMYGRTQATEDDLPTRRLCTAYREAFIGDFGAELCKELRERGYGSGGDTPCSALLGRAVQLFFHVVRNKAELFSNNDRSGRQVISS